MEPTLARPAVFLQHVGLSEYVLCLSCDGRAWVHDRDSLSSNVSQERDQEWVVRKVRRAAAEAVLHANTMSLAPWFKRK